MWSVEGDMSPGGVSERARLWSGGQWSAKCSVEPRAGGREERPIRVRVIEPKYPAVSLVGLYSTV